MPKVQVFFVSSITSVGSPEPKNTNVNSVKKKNPCVDVKCIMVVSVCLSLGNLQETGQEG